MKIGIFGISGFAREVADICLAIGYSEVFYIAEEEMYKEINGFPVILESTLDKMQTSDVEFIIGAGSNKVRRKIAEKYINLSFINLIHPSATFGHAQIERLNSRKGNIICAGVRFTNNIEAGNFGIYNLNCTVGHDCVIEDYVNINPAVNISGNVHICAAAFIGTNSSIIQGKSMDAKITIGENAIVGAGSVILRNVEPNTTVAGAPAKPLNK